MGFSDECLKLFNTKDIYQIFHIKKTANNAEIKKAYYKLSILWHPDRFSLKNEEEKQLATQKFQIFSKIYNILSDSEQRKIYDTTGSTEDDDNFSNVNWVDIWRRLFKKITPEDIEKYLKEFRGSEKEMEDVKMAYVKYKGDLDKIFETVIGADVENEDRIREIIRYYIELGEVEEYQKFKNEPIKKRAKRIAKSKKEAQEAKKALKEIQEKEGTDNLVSLIQNRKNKYDNFVSNLEEKYNCLEYEKKPKKKVVEKNSETILSKSTNRKRKISKCLKNDKNEVN